MGARRHLHPPYPPPTLYTSIAFDPKMKHPLQNDPHTGAERHWCRKCSAYLPSDAFAPSGKANRLCRDCRAVESRAYRALHPDRRCRRGRIDKRKRSWNRIDTRKRIDRRKRKRPGPLPNSVQRIHINTNKWMRRHNLPAADIAVSRAALVGLDLEAEHRCVVLRPIDPTKPYAEGNVAVSYRKKRTITSDPISEEAKSGVYIE